MSGFGISVLLVPLYARFPPVLAGAIPAYLPLVGYLLSLKLPMQAKAEAFLAGLAKIPLTDLRVLLVVCCSWIMMAVS